MRVRACKEDGYRAAEGKRKPRVEMRRKQGIIERECGRRDVPTGGLSRCEFSSSHLGKLIGGGSILVGCQRELFCYTGDGIECA